MAEYDAVLSVCEIQVSSYVTYVQSRRCPMPRSRVTVPSDFPFTSLPTATRPLALGFRRDRSRNVPYGTSAFFNVFVLIVCPGEGLFFS